MSMTTNERFKRVFDHKEADRVPFWDNPWKGTIKRWHNEGLPETMSYVDYFDLDKITAIQVDNSPQINEEIIEKTERYTIHKTNWGTVLKSFNELDATPEILECGITTPEKWKKTKKQMVPSKDRINWKYLEKNYKKWREEGYWIQGSLWFGFDVTHSYMVGTERVLIALIENPEWMIDMFNHQLEVNLALLQMIWDKGYTFDSIRWPDDMGYKHSQFFSVDMYREILKPIHKKAVEWAHQKGIYAYMHSCGDIRPFIPELIDIGLDALNPMEVKAGVNPLEVKRLYGNELVLHGGINAVLWNDAEAVEQEIKRLLPQMMENGGYIFASDHSIPNSVSFDDITRIINLLKKIGTY